MWTHLKIEYKQCNIKVLLSIPSCCSVMVMKGGASIGNWVGNLQRKGSEKMVREKRVAKKGMTKERCVEKGYDEVRVCRKRVYEKMVLWKNSITIWNLRKIARYLVMIIATLISNGCILVAKQHMIW